MQETKNRRKMRPEFKRESRLTAKVRKLWATMCCGVLAALAGAPSAHAVTIYAIQDNAPQNLVSFDSATPQTLVTNLPVTGLQTGDFLFGMDFRPATGELYAYSDQSRLYRINPTTAVATEVAGGPLSFPSNSVWFGFDFNPVPDRLRLVDLDERNFRIDPNTLTVITDTNITPAGSITAVAYTNSVAGATSTILYAIDDANDTLYRLNSPNTGVLTTVGALGVNVSQFNGFDIDPRSNTAYAALTVGGVRGLYTINLVTGAATLVNTIGAGTINVQNLAVAPLGSFSFATTTASVDENNVLAVTINRTVATDTAATVQINAAGGTATLGSDYSSTVQTVSFAIGETSKVAYFYPLYDFATEGPETVQLSLSSAEGVGFSGGPLTVTINDVARAVSSATWFNPTPIIIPGTGTGSATGAPASPYPSEIQVSGFLNLPISKVRVSLFDVTHTFPDDIDLVLVAPDGRSTLLMSDAGGDPNLTDVDISFDDDAAAGLPDNTLIAAGTYKPTNFGTGDLFPGGPVAPFGTTLSNLTGSGPNGTWRLFAVDDVSVDIGAIEVGWSLTLDTPPATFAVSPGTVAENAGAATVTVTRSGNTTGNASVDFATLDGSALAGSDYTATSGTLIFANGETSKTITIPILNDLFNEATESFNVSLSNSQSQITTTQITAPTTVTVGITDDDTVPALSIADTSVIEGNSGTTTATFTVTLSSASQNTVSVEFNAPGNGEYIGNSGTLSFAPGITTRSFSVQVLADTEVEGAEGYTVTLSNATGATIADDTATLTINNDDVPVSITSFTPESGAPGTQIVINGTNFSGATQVIVGGVIVAFTVNSPTQITTALPTGANDGEIVVVTPAGTASSATPFTVTPRISSFSPFSGAAPTTGTGATPGTSIVINGQSFQGVTQVLVGGVSAPFVLTSITQITATVPVGAPVGDAQISVKKGDVTVTAAGTFTVAGITRITPASVNVNGLVTIDGVGLGGVTRVLFGNVPCLFEALSPTRILARVPDVARTNRVRVVLGTSSVLSPNVVKVLPRVISITPGSAAATQPIILTGNALNGVTSVKFGNIAASFQILSLGNTDRLRVTVPLNALSGRITVTTTSGSTQTAFFRVLPRITTLSPVRGPVGTVVTISGSGFSGATQVRFGNRAATFTVVSNLSIRATVPVGATSGVVGVRTLFGIATSTQSFTVTPPVAPGHVSGVRLSQINASSASASLRLIFTGALDANDATQVENFALEIAGETVELESAAYHAGVVTLGAPEGTLRAGQTVLVKWKLRDANGRNVTGQANVTVR